MFFYQCGVLQLMGCGVLSFIFNRVEIRGRAEASVSGRTCVHSSLAAMRFGTISYKSLCLCAPSYSVGSAMVIETQIGRVFDALSATRELTGGPT